MPFGGGWGLALACDFRLAVPGAQFWLPELELGVPLGIGTTSRLVSIVGTARAKEIIITGDRYSAEELHSWGMINRSVKIAEAVTIGRSRRINASPLRPEGAF
jgi:enoyl-CoA hydratase